MSEILRDTLRAQRDQLEGDLDHVRRRYQALGLWADNLRVNEIRNRLWEIEERLRTLPRKPSP